MFKSIFIAFMFLLNVQAQASEGGFCSHLFNLKGIKKNALNVNGFEPLAIELSNLEKLFKGKERDVVTKLKFSFNDREYKTAVVGLFKKAGIIVKHPYFGEEFEYVVKPTNKGAKLNEVAWRLDKDFNTKIIFKQNVGSKLYTEATYVTNTFGKNAIYLPMEALYNPINYSVVHEITKAEMESLTQNNKATDFKGQLGYPEKQRDIFYQELYFKDFLAFANEVYVQGRVLLNADTLYTMESSVEVYLMNLRLRSTLDEAIVKHEAFVKIYKNFIEKFKYIKEAKIGFNKKSSGSFEMTLLFEQNKNNNLVFLKITLVDDYLLFSFIDPAQVNFVKIPIFEKQFVKEFKKLAKQDLTKGQIKKYLLNAAQLILVKMDKVNNLVEEQNQNYQQLNSARSNYDNKGEIQNAIDKINQTNNKYLELPSVEDTFNSILDLTK